MKTKINLEDILTKLGSNEARAIAISKLVEKDYLPISQIERAVEVYEKAGRFVHAADTALKAGMNERAVELYQRAVEVYEKAGRFGDAADTALKAGMNDRAERLRNLADLIK